jgi:cell division protein FtsL
MAAPQRRLRYESPVGRPVRGWLEGRGAPGRAQKRAWPRGAWLGRVLMVLVVPVLMLGSVYVHTVAAELEGEANRLEEEKALAESEGERLEVQVTELSEPGRIRKLAKENLGMQDPGKDLMTYGRDGEDVVSGGGEKEKAPNE